MSRRQQVTSSFASKTTFDALAISDEEDEVESEEELDAHESMAKSSTNNEPLKLTPSAKKRAARNARLQARKDKKAQRTASPATGPSDVDEADADGRARERSGTQSNPVEVLSENESTSTSSAVIVDAEPLDAAAEETEQVEESTPVLTASGHAPQLPSSSTSPSTAAAVDPIASSAKTSTSESKPSAFPTSPVDMAMRTASQTLAVNPLSPKSDSAKFKLSEEPTSPHTKKEKKVDVKEPEPLAAPSDKEVTEKSKKRQSFFVRTLWTLIMIGGFLLCLMGGHAYMVVLVMVCQTVVYREVTALFPYGAPKSEDGGGSAKRRDPWSKTLNWYFFVVTNFFLYGESIIYYFKHVVFADWHFSLFAANHRFTSFSLYTIGFVGFVYSLQRQYLKSQFGLFCWVHMSLLVIVVSSHFIMNNILEGLIWFWVPASLVICNDIFAYICGITFGRTPLIQLSPKKTVEGFIGAFFCTILFSQFWGTFFMRFNYMICPAQNLGANAFSSISCTPNPVFLWSQWELPPSFRMLLAAIPLPGTGDIKEIDYAPYQFHLLVMSCFASLVAPFGGFFASGFKRAFGIKDFGHSIPGHGGMTDRMDCQFLMGVFTYVYYSSVVKEHHVTVGHVLQLIVSGLTLEEQIELMGDFKRFLEGRGVSL